jgi:hypothetical protein
MPLSYYRHSITKAEIQLCQQNYDHIWNDLLPAHSIPIPSSTALDPSSPPSTVLSFTLIHELYDSKRSWFTSLLSDGISELILTNGPSLSAPGPSSSPSAPSGYLTQPFLNKMLEMIRLSFLQWNALSHFQHQLVILARECCHYGIKSQDFIAFGPILFHSLSVVMSTPTGSSYPPELDNAWKSLYSSILAVIIPFCLENIEMVIPAPAAAEGDGRQETLTGFESKPIQNEPPIPPAPPPAGAAPTAPLPFPGARGQASVAASSRLRMMTSLTNSVAL